MFVQLRWSSLRCRLFPSGSGGRGPDSLHTRARILRHSRARWVNVVGALMRCWVLSTDFIAVARGSPVSLQRARSFHWAKGLGRFSPALAAGLLLSRRVAVRGLGGGAGTVCILLTGTKPCPFHARACLPGLRQSEDLSLSPAKSCVSQAQGLPREASRFSHL